MSDPMTTIVVEGLEAARRALVTALLDDQTRELFGSPVDPESLGLVDYFDVIKKPKDLGTILSAVTASQDAAKEENGNPIYKHANQVLQDAQLVWSNCVLYNELNDDILRACRRSERLFNKEWTGQGLKLLGAEDLDAQNTSGAGGSKAVNPPRGNSLIIFLSNC